MKTIILLTFLLVSTNAFGARIIYQNKCPDIDQKALAEARAIPDKKASYEAVSALWACHNETQAAQSDETRQQVNQAIRRAGYSPSKIYSVDPKIGPKNCNPDAFYGDCEWTFGAWYKNGKIYFAAMPGCSNAMWDLEKLLRRLKYSASVRK